MLARWLFFLFNLHFKYPIYFSIICFYRYWPEERVSSSDLKASTLSSFDHLMETKQDEKNFLSHLLTTWWCLRWFATRHVNDTAHIVLSVRTFDYARRKVNEIWNPPDGFDDQDMKDLNAEFFKVLVDISYFISNTSSTTTTTMVWIANVSQLRRRFWANIKISS